MRILLVLGLFWSISACQAQFFDDFSSKLTPWRGDTSHFWINDLEQLQLKTTGSGTSSLWRKVERLDTLIWQGSIDLDFAPSNSNQIVIWLIADAIVPRNGIFFRLGESGSQDSVRIFQRNEGVDHPLGSLFLPNFSTDHPQFDFHLDGHGMQSTFTLGMDTVETTIDIDLDLNGQFPFYFGITCHYTSTRSDKFYFDDIGVGQLRVDTTPPKIKSITVIDSQHLLIHLSESVNPDTPPHMGEASPDLGNFFIDILPSLDAIKVSSEGSMTSGQSYSSKLHNLIDERGNRLAHLTISWRYIKPRSPKAYDILITEFLPDPSPAKALPDCEFVELWNRTDDFLELTGMTLSDATSQAFLPDSILEPGEYVILCDPDCLESYAEFGRAIPVDGLPNLNNNGDDVLLIDYLGQIVHGFTFDPGWYQDPDRSEGGWSIEMIHPQDVCLGASNWRAADIYKCGSPGQANTTTPSNHQPKPLRIEQATAPSSFTIELTFDRELLVSQEELHLVASPDPHLLDWKVKGKNLNLNFRDSILTGQGYRLTLSDVFDCLNLHHSDTLITEAFVPRSVDSGDVVINEVLFNPRSGGVDFVELKNVSRDHIELDRFCLEAQTDNDTTFSCRNERILIPPKGVVALTSDTSTIHLHYPSGRLERMELPPLNDKFARLKLFEYHFSWSKTLDEATNDEDWHSPVLGDVDGVSLEKRRPTGDGRDANHWHSASSTVGFATPGLDNSVYIEEEIETDRWLDLSTPYFTPDGDGNIDFVEIFVAPEKEGFNLRMDVYDLEGRYITRLSDNDLLGTQQVFVWDGTNIDGQLQSIGLYLILAEMAHPNGEMHREKVTVVLN